MKRLLIFMSFLFFAALGSYADEEISVKLNDEHTKEQVHLDYCNIFVTKVDSDDDGNAKVTVEIENINEKYVIILFGHAYPEKDLKKLSPSITFDKYFNGTKGDRDIDIYREARNVFINPPEKSMLPEIQVKSGEVKTCRLPLYFAKTKGKNKMLLMNREILELKIEVEVKPDEDYIRIEKECNDLIEEISKQTFCNHPKHKTSLESQEAPYKTRIGNIKKEIDDIINRRWFSNDTSDKGYQRYDALRQKLDTIDFTAYEGDCGNSRNHRGTNPPRPRHSCKYCNSSLQQIYHKLDDYYKKIYNRKATKESVMADVNLLYKCCTDGNCSKHASSWNSSEYKSKITDRYNRISNF